jgi:protoheme IX farnesyltransferase
MSTEPMVVPLSRPVSDLPHARTLRILADYCALTKPEVNFLILISTFVGFYLGCAAQGRGFPISTAINTVIGTLLVASGTGTLNQYIERDFDSRMRRTVRRPLAAGRLDASRVLGFGIALSVAGGFYLMLAVNVLASILAIVTLLSYLFLYTPLKRKTPLCTVVGAIPGAVPPLIGWVGATGRLDAEAWVLYTVLFLWQFPHFMAIAWMYREDYTRAGYDVLPLNERSRTRLVDLQTLLPLISLLLIGLFPFVAGRRNLFAGLAESLLSTGFLYCGLQFILQKSNSTARRLLTASIVYLFLVFAVLVLAGVDNALPRTGALSGDPLGYSKNTPSRDAHKPVSCESPHSTPGGSVCGCDRARCVSGYCVSFACPSPCNVSADGRGAARPSQVYAMPSANNPRAYGAVLSL